MKLRYSDDLLRDPSRRFAIAGIVLASALACWSGAAFGAEMPKELWGYWCQKDKGWVRCKEETSPNWPGPVAVARVRRTAARFTPGAIATCHRPSLSCCRIDQCTCSQCDCHLYLSYNQIDPSEGWCPGRTTEEWISLAPALQGWGVS